MSGKASATGASSVLAHLSTKQNFEPLRKTESPDQSKGELPKGPVSPADMEAKVLELTEITPDDFKKLMDKRAAAVEGYLLQSGKVTPERVTVIAPKTVDASFQGSNRVDLTLQ